MQLLTKLTIRMKNLASYVRGAMVTSKEDIGWSNFNRLTSPAHRHSDPNLAHSSSPKDAGINGVQMGPGATPLTLMPFCTSWRARALV